MSPKLKQELEALIDIQLESQDYWEEGETRTRDEMEIIALEDIISLDRDCGGHYEMGILPTFQGSPEWVAEMIAQQQRSVEAQKKQHREWLKLWREAAKELESRQSNNT